MKVNSFKTTAAFVRAFFDAFTRGVIDATAKTQQEKTDTKFVKQAMLNHYEQIYQHFMQTAFMALCRLNYPDFAHMQDAMPESMRQGGANFQDYLRIACKTQELYDATVEEYKRNFSALLTGHIPSPTDHLASYTQGTAESIIEEPMAVHLLTRLVIQAYVSGLQAATPQSSPQMPSLHSLLLSNAICLLHDAPIKPKEDEELPAFFERACKSEENLNALFNTLNDTMQEMATE